MIFEINCSSSDNLIYVWLSVVKSSLREYALYVSKFLTCPKILTIDINISQMNDETMWSDLVTFCRLHHFLAFARLGSMPLNVHCTNRCGCWCSDRHISFTQIYTVTRERDTDSHTSHSHNMLWWHFRLNGVISKSKSHCNALNSFTRTVSPYFLAEWVQFLMWLHCRATATDAQLVSL